MQFSCILWPLCWVLSKQAVSIFQSSGSQCAHFLVKNKKDKMVYAGWKVPTMLDKLTLICLQLLNCLFMKIRSD